MKAKKRLYLCGTCAEAAEAVLAGAPLEWGPVVAQERRQAAQVALEAEGRMVARRDYEVRVVSEAVGISPLPDKCSVKGCSLDLGHGGAHLTPAPEVMPPYLTAEARFRCLREH